MLREELNQEVNKFLGGAPGEWITETLEDERGFMLTLIRWPETPGRLYLRKILPRKFPQQGKVDFGKLLLQEMAREIREYCGGNHCAT